MSRNSTKLIKRSRFATRDFPIFAALLQSAPPMLWMAGPNRRCTFFNQWWLEFTGRSLQQELDHGWLAGVHPDDIPRCLGAYDSAFAERCEFQVKYRLRRADGAYRWLLDSGGPLFAADGGFAGFVGAATDLTAHRLAVDAAAQLAAIVDSSDDAIIGETLDGVITSWSPGAERLYGYSAAEAVGKSISILIPAGYADELPPIREQLKRGMQIDHYETVRKTKHGRLLTISLTVSPVRDPFDAVVAAFVIERDLTERTRDKDLIRRLSTPILQIREDLLIVPLIGLIDESRANQVCEQLLYAIKGRHARVVVVDLTGVPSMKGIVAQRFTETLQACRLLGARVVMTGISTAVARALVEAQVELRGLDAQGDLQRGIEEAVRVVTGI